MAIHVRNMKTPTLTTAWSAHATTILMREFLKLAGWTDKSINTGPIGPAPDAAWASCLIINDAGAPGFTLAAASPGIVTDPGARFLSTMVGYNIFLNGALNKGAFQITRFIDTGNVEVDPLSTPPTGWVNESAIPGRVVNVMAARLAVASTFLSQAPTGNLQARAAHASTSSCLCYARPKGGAALATEVPAAGQQMANGTDTFLRFNAVLDGKNCFISVLSSASAFRAIMWGELTNVDTGDANPGFVALWSSLATHWTASTAFLMYMLNSLDVQIQVFPTFIKPFSNSSYLDMGFLQQYRKLLDGRPGLLHVRIPKVVQDNVAGQACVRGKMPLVRATHYYLETFRPINAAGTWQHFNNGLAVPRNGPGDKIPVVGG